MDILAFLLKLAGLLRTPSLCGPEIRPLYKIRQRAGLPRAFGVGELRPLFVQAPEIEGQHAEKERFHICLETAIRHGVPREVVPELSLPLAPFVP